MKIFITRFAPTPSGYLHVGNCVTFAITWLMTRAVGGKIHLRIDDLDAERTRPEYVEDIFKTLDWLGLDYDFGPSDIEDFFKNHSQHKRIEIYNKYLESLAVQNEIYACRCSRQDIRNISPNRKYPNICRDLNLDLETPNTAWRIKLPEELIPIHFHDFNGEINGTVQEFSDDFIVRQKNGLPAYHLASLVDDYLMGVTVIIRGEDLFDSTAIQIYLAERVGLNSFIENLFVHLPLIKQANGKKISKSAGNADEWKLKKTEAEKQFIFKTAANWFNLHCENFTAKEVLKAYSENLQKNL